MSTSLLARRFGNDFAKLAVAGLLVALTFEWRVAVGKWLDARYPRMRATPVGRLRLVVALTAAVALVSATVTTLVAPGSRPHALGALKITGLAPAK